MIRLNIDAERILEHEFSLSNRQVEYNGEFFDYTDNEDRANLYSNLKRDGYQVFIMKNDYNGSSEDSQGNDIAVLDASCASSKDVKLKIGEHWTPFMSIAQARERFVQWSLDSNSSDYRDDAEFGESDFATF